MSRVVVLGDTGFIGRRLAAALRAAGHEVLGHSSRTLDLTAPTAGRLLAETLDRDTTVFVVSALTPDKGQTIDTLTANVAMLAAVGRCLEARPVRKCVYVSSDAVYPMTDVAVTEASPVEPAALYALGKYAGERILHRSGETAGVPILSLRVTGVYGPGDTHGSYGPNLFARTAVREKTVRVFGQGEETRDHVYVEDVARIAARLGDSDRTGVLNVASGASRSFAAVVEELRRVVPHQFEVVHLPRKAAITHRRFDVTELRAALPGLVFTDFSDGLRELVAWTAAAG